MLPASAHAPATATPRLARRASGSDEQLLSCVSGTLVSPSSSISDEASGRRVSGDDIETGRRSPAVRGDVGGWRNFLHRCARTWLARSGGVALQRAAGAAGSYAALLACELGEEDADQIAADVGRSAVDDIGVVLGDLVFEAALREALGRVLRAWCARRAGGYCQGMNFAASVVLAVMRAGRPAGGGSGAASPTAPSPTAPSPTAAAAEWEEWEEAAFWTFVGMVELLSPADFYAAPEMAGLQRECRVLQILARSELRALRGLNDDEVNAVLHLLSYKWFIPFYVNCVPIRTLLLYWDRLLLPPAAAPPPSPAASSPSAASSSSAVAAADGSSAHLRLALALLSGAQVEMAEAMRGSRAGEGVGVAFELCQARAAAAHASRELFAAAAAVDISREQLRYLRQRLAAAPPRAGVAAELSGMEAAAYALLARRRSEALPIMMLKDSLLLRPPPPPPASWLALVPLPHHYPRLVSACVLCACSFGVWASRAALMWRRGGALRGGLSL